MLNENKMNQFMQQIMNERDAKEKALGFSQTTSEMRSILKSIVETPEKDIVDVLETERKEIVFECDRKLRLVSDILSDENVISLYGNQTVANREEFMALVKSIPTGEKDSLLILTMDAYDCNETQALTKIALALNISNKDSNCWFNQQLETINYNKALLENIEQIAKQYPKVYSKLRDGERTQRKYYIFLLEAFEAKLERRGLFFTGDNAPLITAESFRTVSKTLRVRLNTARDNMDDLHNFGFTRKLTNEQLKELSPIQYGEIKTFQRKMKYIAAHVQTITNYELIRWTDDVLANAEQQIIHCNSSKLTHQAHNFHTMNAVGYSDTVSKRLNKEFDEIDKKNLRILKKWAKEKFRDKGCQFITSKEWTEQFNNPDKKNTVYAGSVRKETYRVLIMSDLDLVAVYATKECREVLQSSKKYKNKKSWQGVAYQSQIYIKRELYEANTKIFSLVK